MDGSDNKNLNETLDIQEVFKYSDLSRRDLRSLIFHLLYALEAYNYEASIESIVDNMNRGYDLDIPLDSEAVHVTRAVAEERKKLDEIIERFLTNWRLDRLGCNTRLVLRLGVWELIYTDNPSNIVINEAVELAKCFSEADAYRFINGVLDEVSKKLPELKEEFTVET